MNAYVKGRILAEIKNPANKTERFARMGDERMSVTSQAGRVVIEIFNDWDSGHGYSLKLGGEEIDVEGKDFSEIANALRARCDSGKAEKLSAEDKKILALLSGEAKQK